MGESRSESHCVFTVLTKSVNKENALLSLFSEDHAKGLSTFTIMAGLGGSIGYFLGALDWESTFLGK